MSNVIEEFYYGNLEPQELTTELTPKLKKKLSEIVIKEEELTSKLSESEKELFSNYTRTYIQFSSMSNSDSLEQDLFMTLLSLVRKDNNYEKESKDYIPSGW